MTTPTTLRTELADLAGENILPQTVCLESEELLEFITRKLAEAEKAAELYGRSDELVKLSDWGKTIDDQWNEHFKNRLAQLKTGEGDLKYDNEIRKGA